MSALPVRFATTVGRAAASLLGLALALVFSGCTSTDAVRSAQRALDRALTLEPPAAFYGPVLARAQGLPPPPAVPPRARPYYLTVIAEMETLGPVGKENLKRNGLLGNALALKLLAQWRLGRFEAARASLVEFRAAGQDALDLRDRILVASFAGISQLERALDAFEANRPYEEIYELIMGDGGAWRSLGNARMESARTGAPAPEVLEARLAAFKVLHDARARLPVVPTPANVVDEAWLRVRSEAQIEVNQLAQLPDANPAAHAARVQRWRTACGLDATSP